MNEKFYQLYKFLRDSIYNFGNQDLHEPFLSFIETEKDNCDQFDEIIPEYLDRWQNERFLLFRRHLSTLDESMNLMEIINSHNHLVDIVKEFWPCPFEEISIIHYIYDSRIDWDTHMVLVHQGDKSYPAGYLNKKPHWLISDRPIC